MINRTMPGFPGYGIMDKNKYITLLQNFHKKYNRSPKKREISCYSAICNVFGSWNKALEEAGLPIRREINASPEKLRISLLDYYKKHNKSPRAEDCTKTNGLYDPKTYFRILKLNTWAKVLESVKLPSYFEFFDPKGRNEIEILIEVSIFIRVNKITSFLKYNKVKIQLKANLPGSKWLTDQYGTWNNMLKQAGLAINLKRYTKKMYIDGFKELASKGKVPSLSEFAKHLGVAPRLITNRFGSYNKFVTKLGYIPKHATPKTVTENNEKLKKLYIEFSKKYGYINGAPASALDASNEIYCRKVFENRFGSLNNLRKECGYQPVEPGPVTRFKFVDVKEKLLQEYKSAGRKLKIQEIENIKDLPNYSTIRRLFKTTSIKKVWEIVLSES